LWQPSAANSPPITPAKPPRSMERPTASLHCLPPAVA
jgi:hypothetical protein